MMVFMSRVPMGAKNAASHFQRVMTQIFQAEGLLFNGVLVWIDDVLLYAGDEEGLLKLWLRVLTALERFGMHITPEKSNMFCLKVLCVVT